MMQNPLFKLVQNNQGFGNPIRFGTKKLESILHSFSIFTNRQLVFQKAQKACFGLLGACLKVNRKNSRIQPWQDTSLDQRGFSTTRRPVDYPHWYIGFFALNFILPETDQQRQAIAILWPGKQFQKKTRVIRFKGSKTAVHKIVQHGDGVFTGLVFLILPFKITKIIRKHPSLLVAIHHPSGNRLQANSFKFPGNLPIPMRGGNNVATSNLFHGLGDGV